MIDAEVAWLRGVVADLVDGTLTRDLRMIAETLKNFG